LIKKDLCNIIEYYDLESNTCWINSQTEEDAVDITPDSGWSMIWNIMKWVFIILWILVVIFVWMIVLFAIKSKKNRESWEEDSYEDTYEDEPEDETNTEQKEEET
jgi:heme/copper-type cytochrome/quinol oxidase subunit 2